MRMRFLALPLALLFCGLLAPTSKANSIVVNGGFETGDLTGWTASVPSWFASTGSSTNIAMPYDGNYFAMMPYANFKDMSQTLTTVAGTTYELQFAFNPGTQDGTTGDTGRIESVLGWKSHYRYRSSAVSLAALYL